MNLGAVINATPALIEQLGIAFLELEGYKNVTDDEVQWKEVEEHFRHLETMMWNKYLEIEVREKTFREEESEARKLLTEREGAVAAKEQDLLDQIQELKDAAVVAIVKTRADNQLVSLEPMDDGDNIDDQVSSPLGENAEGVSGEVKPCPELLQFCEQMDAKGLLNFTMENQKNIPSLRHELPLALESAAEPGHLVLASLGEFLPPDDTTQEGDKNDAAHQGMLQSCLMLMEAMATLLARADPGADHLLNPEIKQQAKAIANEWKPKLAGAGIDAANGNSLEAKAFLQLIATFMIASEFDEEELCKLVLAVSHHRQAPELCRSVGLTHKVPGVVEALIDSGKQIDAVHFIHAFQLTESFPLVPLLKAYLKDLRRNSQGKNDANAQELEALRAIIRCVQDYKLEVDYPLDPLQKRVSQLEKLKPDRKRSGDSGKHHQFKKPRANGGFYGSRAPVASTATAVPAPPVFGGRATYAGVTTYDYQAAGQSAYAQQAYDQTSYYYPHNDMVNATAYNAAPSTYGTYPSSGMQSTYQPY
ncbi:unnamed protein product [Ilex paraguariensis]|uniref:FRIGIDA-like protein n=1 Tax=Ilex paraguariensis TaxID=185542 RepID=A0ABC8UYY7_9AQUA